MKNVSYKKRRNAYKTKMTIFAFFYVASLYTYIHLYYAFSDDKSAKTLFSISL